MKRLYRVDPIERFNQKYIVDDETGCWNWQGALDKGGYGVIKIKAKMIKAHRFSYETFVGPLIKELECCHICHNRKCVRPDHLRQDTKSSNMIDRVHQQKHPCQILSVEEVIEIKKALQNPYRGQQQDLAHFYKVNQPAISNIKTGTTWSHIVI
jgi:hypothetical protein